MGHNCLHGFMSAMSQCLFFLPRAISALMRLSDWGVMKQIRGDVFQRHVLQQFGLLVQQSLIPLACPRRTAAEQPPLYLENLLLIEPAAYARSLNRRHEKSSASLRLMPSSWRRGPCARKGEVRPFLTDLETICRDLDAARPTAVNLHWALTQMMACARQHEADGAEATTAALEEKAVAIHKADIAINTAMARFGADELEKLGRPLTLLTHCNAGALATAGVGTALGVIRELHRRGLVSMVYADETRPLLQGARLTAFELMADHIPVTLITDNMAAWTLKTKGVDAIIVGADRIAANGDTANKIGTYGLSLMARELAIPLYIAAPASTFDLSITDGSQIPIEERNHDEVRFFPGVWRQPSPKRPSLIPPSM